MHPPDLPLIAGTVSTSLFVLSYLPMLAKAVRTRDLTSYSIGNLLIANVGNAVHSVYVFSLPVGPIWFLHSFYLLSTAVMLFWYWRSSTLQGGRTPGAALPPIDVAGEGRLRSGRSPGLGASRHG